jgi:predicted N-acetyltransferase YhbS
LQSAATAVEIVHLERPQLSGTAEIAVRKLIRGAFPDAAGDLYDRRTPDRTVLLWDADDLIGHIAAYIRPVLLGDEAVTIGLIGDVAIAPGFQSRGYAKRLIREVHEFFGAASLPFSVLFAFEPERYRSSGYRPMTNETRFLDADGSWKKFVYRGGMVTELGCRKWPDLTLDLQGEAV